MKPNRALDPIEIIRQKDLQQSLPKKRSRIVTFVLGGFVLLCIGFWQYHPGNPPTTQTLLSCEIHWHRRDITKSLTITNTTKEIFPLFVPQEKFADLTIIIKTFHKVILEKPASEILTFEHQQRRGKIFLQNQCSRIFSKKEVIPRQQAEQKLQQLAKIVKEKFDEANNKTFASLFQSLYSDSLAPNVEYLSYSADYQTIICVEIGNK